MSKDAEQINEVCIERFRKSEESDERIIELLEKLHNGLEELHERLFVDNGRLSFQTRLNRVCRVQNVSIWVFGAFFTIVILGVSARLIYDALSIAH